jgi:hypothetical protein
VPPPWFAISTNSSLADAPPVATSDTTRGDGGHVTTAATLAGSPGDPIAPPTTETTTRQRSSAASPARRARSIVDLRAGVGRRLGAAGRRGGRQGHVYQPALTAGLLLTSWRLTGQRRAAKLHRRAARAAAPGGEGGRPRTMDYHLPVPHPRQEVPWPAQSAPTAQRPAAATAPS